MMRNAPRHVRHVVSFGRRPHSGLGAVVIGLGLTVATAALVGRAGRSVRPEPLGTKPRQRALNRSRDGAAILSFSALADSALEHYRGGYHHRTMYAAPTIAALSLAASLAEPRLGPYVTPIRVVHAASALTGILGISFHSRNVMQRPGGICWNNLFYAAPLGAPGSLSAAGLIGAATHSMALSDRRHEPDADRRHGRQLAALSGGSLAAETAEVWLLHFRGAYHNPAMFLPVTVPPLAAVGLFIESIRPHPTRRAAVRRLLQMVGMLGVVGTGFHIFGVARNMGGWGNWRQTALQGPPTPAPISFTGLGLSGLAALDLLDSDEDIRG